MLMYSGLALGWAQSGVRDSIARVPAGAVVAARMPSGSPVAAAGVTFLTGTDVHAFSPDWSPAGDRVAVSTGEVGQPWRVGYLTVSSGAVTLLPGEPPPTTGLSDTGAIPFSTTHGTKINRIALAGERGQAGGADVRQGRLLRRPHFPTASSYLSALPALACSPAGGGPSRVTHPVPRR